MKAPAHHGFDRLRLIWVDIAATRLAVCEYMRKRYRGSFAEGQRSKPIGANRPSGTPALPR
jgi:hypothetical protein